MKLQQVIEDLIEYYVEKETVPSHCDVRCAINDMLDDSYNEKGYNQDRAFKIVRKSVCARLGIK